MPINARLMEGIEPVDSDHWAEMIEELAAEGQRVIAVAARVVEQDQPCSNASDIDGMSPLSVSSG